MSVEGQQWLLDEEPAGTSVEIETSGRVIRPLLELPTAIVDECKVRADDDGLSITTVDPANVAMVDFRAPASAFEAFDVAGGDEATVGLPLDSAVSHCKHARLGKSTDDPVALTLDAATAAVEIEREYRTTTTRRRDEWLNIDVDSIRQEPDVPDLALPWEATVDSDAFRDAIQAASTASDHATLREDGGDMSVVATGDDGVAATATHFESAAEYTGDDEGRDRGATSVFSLDYLTDLAAAVCDAKINEVTVRWGEEFPLFLGFERTRDEETVYEGRYMLAPRISSGDDE